jgi:CheY-like chemotaxis protein
VVRRLPLVLIVEDSDETYELFSDVLAGAGYAVTGADDGVDAIQRARQLQPDLIVLDLGLPRLNGCDAARQLKADDHTKHIPILAVTGYVTNAEAKRAREAGCDGFLAKPCHIDDLVGQVTSHLPLTHEAPVLIVEDDHAVRDTLAELLLEEGHRVAVACNGKEALEYLHGNPAPGLILLDLMMPIVDGWQFRAAQQENPLWQEIPVIVISAIADLQRVEPLHVEAVLRKPLDLTRLMTAVERYLRPN